MSYLEVTKDVYKEAALTPDVGLCCTTTPVWQFPGLSIPTIMQEMNYGCGSTVHPRALVNNPKILYVGVGGGMELLQFAYFSRQKEGVIGIDVVDEMLAASRKNFVLACKVNIMQRRTALKNIGLSFGALTLTPTVASLLQSCQTTEAGWVPTLLSQENADIMAKIIDVILPTTANVPGASDLNLIQFIDGYLANVSSPEEQEFAKMATGIFAGVALAAAGKESAADLTAEDIDVQLNKFLRAT